MQPGRRLYQRRHSLSILRVTQQSALRRQSFCRTSLVIAVRTHSQRMHTRCCRQLLARITASPKRPTKRFPPEFGAESTSSPLAMMVAFWEQRWATTLLQMLSCRCTATRVPEIEHPLEIVGTANVAVPTISRAANSDILYTPHKPQRFLFVGVERVLQIELAIPLDIYCVPIDNVAGAGAG